MMNSSSGFNSFFGAGEGDATAVAKRGFSEKEASIYTGLARSTLRQGRMHGRRENRIACPPYSKVGNRVIYLRDDLDSWLESNRRS